MIHCTYTSISDRVLKKKILPNLIKINVVLNRSSIRVRKINSLQSWSVAEITNLLIHAEFMNEFKICQLSFLNFDFIVSRYILKFTFLE